MGDHGPSHQSWSLGGQRARSPPLHPTPPRKGGAERVRLQTGPGERPRGGPPGEGPLGDHQPSLGHRKARATERKEPLPLPSPGPARPLGPEAQLSSEKGGAGADRREDTYLKGYIVSLFALPEAAATPPRPWARTSVPNTPARRLHSTAHPLTPPLGGAAPQGLASTQ